ncbi:S-layer homology domain-containing protein [Paenibacillus sp. GCM10027626]|uniref:S-layer homology domain-containing protein n=1 Tax=Paenibacillus sp. GCM10027626 TaxID=3273411 RepID=UPI00363BDF4C
MYILNRRWSKLILLPLIAAMLAISAPIVQAMPAAAAENEAAVYAYQPSIRYDASVNYTLKVNGVDVPVVKAFNDYDYAHFSVSEGKVTYEVTILNTDKVHEYAISPKKLGIQASKVEGRTITFTTEKDEYLIVMINSRATKLVIAADPIETDVPAPSGTGIYNLAEAPYHVTGNGERDGVAGRTAVFQQAIDDASAYGTAQGQGTQGIVYVPAGTYYIGNLVMKSNTALYLAPGATLVGTGKTADYKEHWFKNSMGRPATWWISTEFHSSNIKIYGRGTIDGNGKALHDDKSTNGKGMINNLVVPIATENFTLDGIVIRESAAWAVMPVRSNDLLFTNMKMFNSLSMGENDGIDIVESQNAVIRHTIGIALDDPYSTKAWKEDTDIASGTVPWPGNPEPVENVLFEDAIAWTWCYGYKIGQGVMQDQRNITFKDAVVYKAAVGFAIHHKYGTGEVSGVTFENIDVEDVVGKNEDNSAWMTMFTVESGNNGVGPITGVKVKNITVRDAGESFAKIKGMEGAEITDITFENVYMPGSTEPATTLNEMNFHLLENYSGVTIKPVQNPEPRPRTNLALNQPAVASSSDLAEDTAALAFDGNPATRFTSKRGIDPSWIYVDLGEKRNIDRVHLYWEAAYGRSYQIQVADDPDAEENWRTVYSTTNGKGGVEEIAFPETEARYVRMYGTERATIYGYSLWEMEVYGPEVFVDSIALDKTSATLALGDSMQLIASLLPEDATNKKVRWSSSNSAVAKVDANGLVTTVGIGNAIITARTQNGELSATAAFIVTEPGEAMEKIAPNDTNIRYIGRWENSAGEKAVSYWPGASFRVGFTGKKAQLALDKPAAIYAQIDDGDFVLYDGADGTINLTPSLLSDGTHRLTVVAKDVLDSIAFKGLYLDSGESTVPLPERSHLIEFIGDSITVGYRMPDVALDSYAWLAGEELNADHMQIAYTGICLQTGIACYTPNSLGMSEQYFKLRTGDDVNSPDWDFGRYEPDAVVINLGTNDDKFQVGAATFQRTYTDFLAQIRERYPHAHLIALKTFGGFMTEPTKAAVEGRIAAGDEKVHFIDTSGWVDAYPSSDYFDSLHPSKAGHEKIARQLVPVLRDYLEQAPPLVTVPDAPTQIQAIAGDRSATVSFNPPENDGGNTITGYEVVSSPDNIIASGASSPIIVKGLTNGTQYTFTVKAINNVGSSATSSASNAVTPAAQQPDGDTNAPEWQQNARLAVTDVTATSVKLHWPEATDDIGVAGYRIYVDGAVRTTVTGTVYERQVEGLTPGTAYQFGVAAYDAAGNESPALNIAVKTLESGSNSNEGNGWGGWVWSNNADLRDLQVRADGVALTLSPSFSAGVLAYAAETTAEQAEILASATHEAAEVTIGGEPNGSGIKVALQEGDNVFAVKVRAEDGTVKTYSLTIVRKSLDPEVPGLEAGEPDEGAVAFADIAGHWAADSIMRAVAQKIVKGYPDRTFRPDNTVTRAEFIVMLANALQLEGEGGELAFTDRDRIGVWSGKAIAQAVAAGIVNGYPDGSFRPNAAITRMEMAAMIARALDLPLTATAAGFADDKDIPQWAKRAVAAVEQRGIVTGRPGSKFMPKAIATRAEAAVMLMRM